MSKKDEALDLALEALENLFGIPAQWTGEGGGDVAVWRLGGSHRAQAALTAIKQARSAPVQKPVAVDQATMELAESVGLIGPASRTHDLHAAIQRFHDLICVNATLKAAKMAADAIREATPAASPVQETAGWKWHQAPVKTQWGHKMVVADLAIDKDNTVSVYCERDQTAKVEAMFNPPAQPAVPLTDEQIEKKFKSRFGKDSWRVIGAFYYEGHRDSEAAHGITKGEA